MADKQSLREAAEESGKVDLAKLQKYQEENYRLKTLLKENKLRADTLSAEKEGELIRQAEELTKLKAENGELKSRLREREAEFRDLSQKLLAFQKALKSQIRTKPTDTKGDLMEEIEQIDDPYALVVINKLLFRESPGPSRAEEARVKGELEHMRATMEAENKKTLRELTLLGEKAQKEIRTLTEQNQFLLSQLAFAEKKLEDRGLKPDFGHSKKESANLKAEIVRIFQLSPDDDIIECLEKIERGYQYVPMMQETLEQVYEIITRNEVLPAMCTSKSQLIEILQNWAANLDDYQNLVQKLFEVMGITDQAFKSRTYLVEAIKKLMATNPADGQENDPSVASVRNSEKAKREELLEELKKLKISSNEVDFFCEDARAKLNLPGNYSSGALYSKLLRILDDPEVVNKYSTNFDASTFT